jgi:hypothetical protein
METWCPGHRDTIRANAESVCQGRKTEGGIDLDFQRVKLCISGVIWERDYMKKPVETEAKTSAPENKPFDIFEGLSNEPFKAGQSSQSVFEAVSERETAVKKEALPLEKISSRGLIYIGIAIAALVVGVLLGKMF